MVKKKVHKIQNHTKLEGKKENLKNPVLKNLKNLKDQVQKEHLKDQVQKEHLKDQVQKEHLKNK